MSSSRQLPATRAASRRAMISAWAVGSWRSSRSLWAAADELAVAHQHRADRHVVVFQRTLGLAQGQAHEVLVAWEEASAHRSRPQCLRQCLPCPSAGASSLLKPMPSPTARPMLRRAAHSISIPLALCATLVLFGAGAPATAAASPARTRRTRWSSATHMRRWPPPRSPAAASSPTEGPRRRASARLVHLAPGESVASALRAPARASVAWRGRCPTTVRTSPAG